MKQLFIYLFLIFAISSFSQTDDEFSINKNDTLKKSLREKPKENPKASFDKYRIVNLYRDTTYVDTSLSIKKEYAFNYLRKDNFGLLAFNNDGQTYNTLDYSLTNNSILPEFGFKAKKFNYYRKEDVNYYSVATPITELYFKTVLEQGQSLDAFITLNTSERLNFSISYKGLRSLGKYVNSLSSTGNFKFTTSYFSKNKRYLANFHYASQDILNNENGGLLNNSDFQSENSKFNDRARLEVNYEDASSLLKGKRYFLDHIFNINPSNKINNILLEHQFSYETSFFEFKKTSETSLFGAGFINSNYNDLSKSNIMYNKLGAIFQNSTIGKFNFFVENYNFNYFYNRTIVSNNTVLVPSTNNNRLNAVGGKYYYNENKVFGEVLVSKSIAKQTFSTLDINAKYKWDAKNVFLFQYLNLSKVPDLNYTLYQSDFVNYNWYNNFKNQKENTIKVKANTRFLEANLQFTTLNNFLFFSETSTSISEILVKPKQYDKTINYLSVKFNKELKLGKFALDNTLLYQEVAQEDKVLNVPKIVTRNALYFTDYFFKKALYLQTGITFQYFTEYYANGYNPLIGEFYSQEKTKIGNFPLADFFINARVRQARIFLKAEHFNSAFTGNNFYSAPNYPYKDFIVRFGLVWTFYQ